jgi:hypothetical protein
MPEAVTKMNGGAESVIMYRNWPKKSKRRGSCPKPLQPLEGLSVQLSPYIGLTISLKP